MQSAFSSRPWETGEESGPSEGAVLGEGDEKTLVMLVADFFLLFCFWLFGLVVWFGLVWFGLVLVWFGLVWFGLVWLVGWFVCLFVCLYNYD